MKTTILLLTILASTVSLAHEIKITTLSPLISTMTTSMMSDDPIKKEVIAKDANDFYQSGVLSPYLAEMVSTLQSHMDLSDSEAVDLLVEYTESELN